MERRIVDYSPELTVTNVDQLPRGTGAPYLLAVESIYFGEFIAKRWLRTMPQSTKHGEVVIRF